MFLNSDQKSERLFETIFLSVCYYGDVYKCIDNTVKDEALRFITSETTAALIITSSQSHRLSSHPVRGEQLFCSGLFYQQSGYWSSLLLFHLPPAWITESHTHTHTLLLTGTLWASGPEQVPLHCSDTKNPFPAWLFMILLDNLVLDQLRCATYEPRLPVTENKSVSGRHLMKFKVPWHEFNT